jgi:hypothetical protein
MLPTLALQPWAGPQHARGEPEIDEKKKESITEKIHKNHKTEANTTNQRENLRSGTNSTQDAN